MKELSLNILDIACNSIKAKAKNVTVSITETKNELLFFVEDDGCGMTKEVLERVADPFTTSRTTRKVGLGIPFLKLAAEQTGGYIQIESRHESEYPENHGTKTSAFFKKDHIDFPPLGDIISTVTTLIQGSPEMNFRFVHKLNEKEILLDTKEMREVLGAEVSLSNPEIINWIADFLREEYASLQ